MDEKVIEMVDDLRQVFLEYSSVLKQEFIGNCQKIQEFQLKRAEKQVIYNDTKQVLNRVIGKMRDKVGSIKRELQLIVKFESLDSFLQTTKPKKIKKHSDKVTCQYCDRLFKTAAMQTHLRQHKAEIRRAQSSIKQYSCPHCVVYFKQPKNLVHHLFQSHCDEKQFKTQATWYYSPENNTSYSIEERQTLVEYVRKSPHFHHMVQQEPTQDQECKVEAPIITVESPPHDFDGDEGIFIRGVTPIEVNEASGNMMCPVCKSLEFPSCKLLATHLRSKEHNIKGINSVFCPHCDEQTHSLINVVTHLFAYHSVLDENNYPTYQVYKSDLIFTDPKTLKAHLARDLDYFTYFQPQEKMGELKPYQPIIQN